MKNLPSRKNIRLKGYDYSKAGSYFVTICVKDKHEMLGNIVGAGSSRPTVALSDYGKIVKAWINKIPEKYPFVKIENSVIMPNHVHMILSVTSAGRQDAVSGGRQDAAPTAAATTTIGGIMGYYKHQTTKEINIPGFWQRSYHDRIIRNQEEYLHVWRYINENPEKWAEDCYFVKQP